MKWRETESQKREKHWTSMRENKRLSKSFKMHHSCLCFFLPDTSLERTSHAHHLWKYTQPCLNFGVCTGNDSFNIRTHIHKDEHSYKMGAILSVFIIQLLSNSNTHTVPHSSPLHVMTATTLIISNPRCQGGYNLKGHDNSL